MSILDKVESLITEILESSKEEARKAGSFFITEETARKRLNKAHSYQEMAVELVEVIERQDFGKLENKLTVIEALYKRTKDL